MMSLCGLPFGRSHTVKTKGTPGHSMSILKMPQGIASFVFLRNLSKWFDSRVNPVQHQVSDHTGKLVKTPSSYKETSNPMPERGMQSIWPVHGGNMGTERHGGSQLLPFDVILLSLSKAAVSYCFSAQVYAAGFLSPHISLANKTTVCSLLKQNSRPFLLLGEPIPSMGAVVPVLLRRLFIPLLSKG